MLNLDSMKPVCDDGSHQFDWTEGRLIMLTFGGVWVVFPEIIVMLDGKCVGDPMLSASTASSRLEVCMEPRQEEALSPHSEGRRTFSLSLQARSLRLSLCLKDLNKYSFFKDAF